MNITSQQLKNIAVHADPRIIDVVVTHFNDLSTIYGLNTPIRAAHFFAQLIHESGSFRHVREIASGQAYEGRADLGNTHPGDGVKYKGHGYIQVTGRNNHAACPKHIFGNEQTLIDDPELLCQPRHAMHSAMWFWNSRDLNVYADKPEAWRKEIIFKKKKKPVNNFEYVTYRINGGFNGVTDRMTHFSVAVNELLKLS